MCGRRAESNKEDTTMRERGNGVYISGGAIAVIVIVILLIVLL